MPATRRSGVGLSARFGPALAPPGPAGAAAAGGGGAAERPGGVRGGVGEGAVRAGAPAVLECLTYRFMGHSRGDPPHGVYRSKDELDHWRSRDPLVLLAKNASIDDAVIRRIDAEIKARVDAAMKFALDSPRPSREALERDIWG